MHQIYEIKQGSRMNLTANGFDKDSFPNFQMLT